MIATLKRRANWLHDLTAAHQEGLQITYWLCVALAIAADLFMVFRLKIDSISNRTWLACEAHPTIEPAGMLLCLIIAYLVRGSRAAIASVFLLGGHLFTHW